MTNLDLSQQRLTPKARVELVRRYNEAASSDHKLWYCQRGRNCDGFPHDGADYPHAQDYQYPPPGFDWDTWFMMCGRGTGKTLSGSNWVRSITKKVSRIALIGRRLEDTRQTMVEGESGIRNVCKAAGESFDWKPALKTFTFQNGAQAFCYSGEEPDSLRGPEHGAGWIDEPCHIEAIDAVWGNYNLGLRQKGYPGGAKTLLSSSPLPIPWTRKRIAEQGQVDPTTGEKLPVTKLVSVPTSRNLHNLDESYIRRVVNPLLGTRAGRQELDAELIEDVEGALWQTDLFQYFDPTNFRFDRIVVGIDPAGSQGKKSDETGIIVAARIGDGFYVLDDFTGKYSPAGWASKAQLAYETYSADAMVVERNFGGDMVEDTLRNHGYEDRVIQVKASDGKRVRAEPIAAIYEQERGYHARNASMMITEFGGKVRNKLAVLEDELVTWVPGMKSPNRLDAMVWAAYELMKFKGSAAVAAGSPAGQTMGPPRPSYQPGSKRSANAAIAAAMGSIKR